MTHTAYIIAGASGAGKTTLSNLLLDADRDLRRSTSYTTRKPRLSEEGGISYHFVAPEIFQKMETEGAFIETTTIYGDRYGTALHTIKKALETHDVLLVLDLNGCRAIKQACDNACVIFLVPAKMSDLEDRLRRRATDSDETIKRRLKEAATETKQGLKEADYIVVNDDSSRALFDLVSIMRAAKLRATNREKLGQTLLDGG